MGGVSYPSGLKKQAQTLLRPSLTLGGSSAPSDSQSYSKSATMNTCLLLLLSTLALAQSRFLLVSINYRIHPSLHVFPCRPLPCTNMSTLKSASPILVSRGNPLGLVISLILDLLSTSGRSSLGLIHCSLQSHVDSVHLRRRAELLLRGRRHSHDQRLLVSSASSHRAERSPTVPNAVTCAYRTLNGKIVQGHRRRSNLERLRNEGKVVS